MKRKLKWQVSRAVLDFATEADKANWINDGKKIWFGFYPYDRAEDKGLTIFAAPREVEQEFELTPENSKLEILEEGEQIVLNASIFFEAELREDVDEEKFEAWGRSELGFCGTLYLGGCDNTFSDDSGVELVLEPA